MTREQDSLIYSRDYTFRYHEFNKKYFYGQCPNIEVYLRKMPKKKNQIRYGYTALFGRPRVAGYIVLNTKLQCYPDLLITTLLHEMIHVRYPEAKEHGKKFKEERRRLILAGVVDDLI